MSKRILVVEDQPDNREIIRDMLADTEYEIAEVKDGEQALAAVTKERPDVILMGVRRVKTLTTSIAGFSPVADVG